MFIRYHEDGLVTELTDAESTSLIREGKAKRTTPPADWMDTIYERMEIGAGKPCIFHPFVGEFGHMILTHIRQCHWHKCDRQKSVICCREGEQVLFPSYHNFCTDWIDPIPDKARGGTTGAREWPEIEKQFKGCVPIQAGGLSPSQEMHYIRPGQRIHFRPRLRGISADICLGIRHREFCPEKNWKHWQRAADAITAAGYTFAVIGQHATSLNLEGQSHHSGDYDTDAAIELLQQPHTLYVGSDTGCTHLAQEIGTASIVFRESETRYRNFLPYMMERNRNLIAIPDESNAWDNPDVIIEKVLAHLNTM